MDSDRQWFKATEGLGDLKETPRSWSFCSDAVADGAVLVVNDASRHPRYADNPLVAGQPGIRAYAGVPFIGRDGLPLGALCVADTTPRDFSARALALLEGLADQVGALMEVQGRDHGAGLLQESVLAEAREPHRLRRALDDRELRLYYQPIVDIYTGRVDRLESLLRWAHPTLGVLSPAAFMPLVEASSLVLPVGRFALEATLAQLAVLKRQGFQLPGGVAVNVASGQLAGPGLASDVFRALERHGVAPTELALEITEMSDLMHSDVATGELSALAAAGVGIVLDDFGVGWSNFARLTSFPVSAIKLDRSIVASVLTNYRSAAVVDAAVNLAKDLGVEVVAEGVETEAVRQKLTALGCRWAQGWLFSKAVPGMNLPRMLAPEVPAAHGLAFNRPELITPRAALVELLPE